MDNRRRKMVEGSISREAKKMIERSPTAAEFSAHFFGPKGRLRQLWTDDAERTEVVKSPLYKELQLMLAQLRTREADSFEQDVERFSGRLTVVVPKSLHAALKLEAAAEGISLAELIRLKLGVPYRLSVRLMAPGKSDSEAA